MALLSVAEARKRLLDLFSPADVEDVPLSECAGRVLARDVVAGRPQPPFAASAMDGFAVRSGDLQTGAELQIIGTSAAGKRFPGGVSPGQAVRIFTGAPVPDGADTILIQEDAEFDDQSLTVREKRDQSRYIRPAGCDFQAGARMTAPRRLLPKDIALIAAMNHGQVTVYRKPVVAIIPTGDELVAPGQAAGDDQIASSNNYGLKAMLDAAGADTRLLPIARDTIDSLSHGFDLADGADAIITLGGASVGDHDLVQSAALSHGLQLEFYRVAMRPGKPLMAGRFGDTPLVGLPGNPVSAMVCGYLFLKPAVGVMLGLEDKAPRRLPAALDCDLGQNGPREHYMRAVVSAGEDGWICRPFERQDSSLLTILSEANALMVRPPHDPAKKSSEKVEFLWID